MPIKKKEPMPTQNGLLVLIKIGNGGGPETFATLGGLRVSRLALNNQALNASHYDSGAWRQLMSGAGVRSLTLTGTGAFTDAASEETLRGYAFAGTANNYQFIFANGDMAAGTFLVTAYERSGAQEGEEIYNIALASAGTITFTAA